MLSTQRNKIVDKFTQIEKCILYIQEEKGKKGESIIHVNFTNANKGIENYIESFTQYKYGSKIFFPVLPFLLHHVINIKERRERYPIKDRVELYETPFFRLGFNKTE